MEATKRLSEIASEAHNGISQAYLAISELDVFDGRGSVGVDRLRGAAKYFEWCADRIKAMADEIQKEQNEKAN